MLTAKNKTTLQILTIIKALSSFTLFPFPKRPVLSIFKLINCEEDLSVEDLTKKMQNLHEDSQNNYWLFLHL